MPKLNKSILIMNIKGFTALLYLIGISISILLLLYGIHVFPIPGTDSVVFIPPAIYYSKGLGLTNPLYYVTKITDFTHQNKFNYYVPLFPFLLGLLSKINPGIKTIFIFCSCFSIASISIYIRAIIRALPNNASRLLKVIVCLSLTYLATYLLPTVGRPENITLLLVFLIYRLYNHKSKYAIWLYNLVLCLLFAFVLSAQIVCFYFCFSFFIFIEVLESKNLRATILYNSTRVVAILAIFSIILAITPNGFSDTINGIYLHTHYVFARTDNSLSLFFHYWLLAPLNVGFLLIFLLSGYFFVYDYIIKIAGITKIQLALSLFIMIFIIVGLFKFILYYLNLYY